MRHYSQSPAFSLYLLTPILLWGTLFNSSSPWSFRRVLSLPTVYFIFFSCGTIRTNKGGERQLYREKAERDRFSPRGQPQDCPLVWRICIMSKQRRRQTWEVKSFCLVKISGKGGKSSKSTEAENQGALWSVCQVGTSEVGCRVLETGEGKQLRESLLFSLNSIILMIFERYH